MSGAHPRAAPPGGMTRGTVVLFAVAVGVSVSNLYYIQPLLPEIHRGLHVPSGVAALAVTVVQAGYALGLVALLPLGDVLERRGLVTVLALAAAAGLGLAAASPTFPVLLGALALVGCTSVLSHILVPYAATLAPEAARGRVVGSVMSGLLVGVLLARAFAGIVAGATNWRVVYVLGAGAMTLLAVALWRRLPSFREPVRIGYLAALASLVTIAREEPLLRRRALFGALSMASFTTLWTTFALLLAAPPFRFDATRIGLVSLVGAASAAGAMPVGRLADRGLTRWVTLAGAIGVTLAWLPLALGRRSLVVLVVGAFAIDLGAQAIHVANQSILYRSRAGARTRLNAVYMTCYFAGATASSAAAGALWSVAGWTGVAGLGAALGTLLVVLALVEARPLVATGATPVAPGGAQPPATAGTIERVSPAPTGVSRPWRKRTSSSAT